MTTAKLLTALTWEEEHLSMEFRFRPVERPVRKWEEFLREILTCENPAAWKVEVAIAFMRGVIDSRVAETYWAAHDQLRSVPKVAQLDDLVVLTHLHKTQDSSKGAK